MNTFWIAFSLLAFAVFKEPCMLTGRPGSLNDASAELENNYSDWNYYCRNNFPSEANLSRPFPILLSFFLLSFPSFPDFSWFRRFLTLFFFCPFRVFFEYFFQIFFLSLCFFSVYCIPAFHPSVFASLILILRPTPGSFHISLIPSSTLSLLYVFIFKPKTSCCWTNCSCCFLTTAL